MFAGRRAHRTRLDRRDGRREGAAVRHRRLQLARPRPGVPHQRVQGPDRVRRLHGAQVPGHGPRRGAVLPARRRSRAGDHLRAVGRPAAQARPGDLVGHRLAAAGPARMRGAVADDRPRADPRRLPHPRRRAGQGSACVRGAGPARDRQGSGVPGPPRGRRHRAARRTGEQRGHRPGGAARRRRGVGGGAVGSEDRPDGGCGRAVAADGPPVRQDHAARRARRCQRRAPRALPADPAPPGRRPVLPRARRPHRDRLLRAPPDAGGPRRRAELRGRAGHAVGAGVHRGGLRAVLAGRPRPAARVAGHQGRGGLQRDHVVHHRRHAADGGVPRAARFLAGRGGVGDALGGCGAGAGAVAGRRAARHRRPRVRRAPLRAGPARHRLRARARVAGVRRGLRRAAPAAAGGTAPAASGEPVLPAPAGAGRLLPGGPRLGTPALVRVQRRGGRRARGAGTGRVGVAVLVAGRRGRGTRDARAGRALRHDPP